MRALFIADTDDTSWRARCGTTSLARTPSIFLTRKCRHVENFRPDDSRTLRGNVIISRKCYYDALLCTYAKISRENYRAGELCDVRKLNLENATGREKRGGEREEEIETRDRRPVIQERNAIRCRRLELMAHRRFSLTLK